MKDVQYRRARAVDYPHILKLQADNYIANLTVEERREGFLSAQFTPAQTAQMAEDLGTIVALIDDAVAGFLCAFRNEFDTGSPVIAAMLAAYDRLRFNGRPLSEFQTYIYGRYASPENTAGAVCCAGFTRPSDGNWPANLTSAWPSWPAPTRTRSRLTFRGWAWAKPATSK
jgi:hypothetical protein